ncbi:hypothetical protein GCM10010121_042770 [Streptomyces brasiliensis]|uniref:Uncharacterized protein n=1 Tax=Streptomyces brasiliensis TaxID=1954 RepID=A0A917NTN6_9ACTN|nr:hypothetical protein GCM10010121_042770 [Streptomyces brasiliensis]
MSPGSRVVYADNDLDAPELRETPARPVALTVIAVVPFMLDEDDAVGVVRRLP